MKGIFFCKYHKCSIAQMLICFFNCYFLIDQPKWSDLDVNQHVNNVKYIGWILEVNFIFFLLMLYVLDSLFKAYQNAMLNVILFPSNISSMKRLHKPKN